MMINPRHLIYRGKRVFHWLKTGLLGGLSAQLLTGQPQKKLKIIAITGTDGKTTTSSLVYQLLKDAGYQVALVSTVAAYIGDEKIDTGFHVTSPAPGELYGFLKKMVAKKMEYLVLEITSQGAYQWRTWGIKPLIAGLTNVDSEHLDYHLTWENYLDAKMLILNQAETAVINDELTYFHAIKKRLKKRVEVLTYNHSARFSAALEKTVRAKFDEDYNRLNAVLAITIAKKLGVADRQLLAGIKNFHLPPGRMEIIPNHLGFTMIVDFAHTAQALEAALINIRRNHLKKGKELVAIFGCAGLRDTQKRPVMGKIATKLADVVIFTAEDPRSENIWSIIAQMKQDVAPHHDKVISIPNRGDALTYAIAHYGKNGNTVAIFGKGHENSMNYDGKTETAWNDTEASCKLIAKLEKRKS